MSIERSPSAVDAGAMAVVAALSSACGSDADGTTDVREGVPERDAPVAELPAGAETETGLPESEDLPATCLLAGSDDFERGDNLAQLTYQYFLAQIDACETRALTSSMSDDSLVDWAIYLENYTNALFGCGVLFEPLPGGVDAFGLANTEAVGVPNPVIGATDARALIAIYMAACSSQLGASAEALAPIRQHLELAAARRVASDVNAALSDCAAPTP